VIPLCSKNKCGPGQPPRPHLSWFPAPPLPPLSGGMIALSPTALARSAAFAKATCRHMILRSLTCNRYGGQQPCLLRRAGPGERPHAWATSSRFRAFPECPPAIHPRELPAATGSAAIIRQAQESPRFAEPTLSQIVSARNAKTEGGCAEAVEDGSSLWKVEENADEFFARPGRPIRNP
jgi:hypothetical protein